MLSAIWRDQTCTCIHALCLCNSLRRWRHREMCNLPKDTQPFSGRAGVLNPGQLAGGTAFLYSAVGCPLLFSHLLLQQIFVWHPLSVRHCL